MTGPRYAVFLLLCSLMSLTGTQANAATASFTLEDVFLEGGGQITGEFDWTYAVGDFAGGSGVFTALDIPLIPGGSGPPLEQEGMVIIIEVNQIEITLDANFHDYGLDITLKLLQPFSLTQSAMLNLDTSFYECCGNGFNDQGFVSGRISPVPLPAALWLFGSALLGLAAARKKEA